MKWNTLVKKKYPLFFLGILVFFVFITADLSLTLNYVKLNRESALHEIEEKVKAGSVRLQFYFNSLRSDLLRIERYLANTNMKVGEELYRYLDFVKGLRPDAIPAILILDANGNAVANTNPALVRVNFWESECFKNIQHTPNRIYLSEAIVLSDLSGRSEAPSKIFEDPLDIGFVLCTGVYSKGEFKGAVVFVLRGEPFFDQYSIAIAEPASGYEFILQEDGRILLHREVELRGKFLSELPESSDLTEADHLLKKTEGKTIAHSAVGEHMTVTSVISLENQRWAVGISTTASKVAQETVRLIYTLSGLALLLGAIIFGLVFALIRLGRTEESLRYSENRFRSIFDNTSVGIALVDKNGHVITANEADCRFLGYSREEIAGMHFSEFTHPDDLDIDTDSYNATVKGERNSYTVDKRYVRKDGEVVWGRLSVSLIRDDDGAPRHTVVVCEDITERKQAEDNIKTLKQRMEFILGVTKTGIDIIDSEFNIRYIDPEWQKVYGDPAGKKCYEYFMDRSKVCPGCGIVKALESKAPVVTEEILAKEGNRPIQVTTIPFQNSEGEWLFAEVNVDITDRKLAEEELKKYASALEGARNNLEQTVQERTKELKEAHEALVRKEKLAVMGQLSSGVAHELRNPLGVIKNACYFLNMKMKTIEDEAVKDNIKIMSREINTADRIITDLLDFARIKEPIRQATDINQLVTETLSKSLIPENITVNTDLPEGMAPVSIDPIQVGQIFLNLIENAVHAMEKGGTLKISTRVKNGITEVIFADEGHGIPKSDLEKIFEPLFTTKAKGIGLGLSVSKSLAKANGVDILVESEEGKGSRFVVRFSSLQTS